MSVSKRITYLKGMAEGLGLGNGTKEERVLQLMIDILEEMSDEIEALSANVLVLDDDVSNILDDVLELESALTDDPDDDEEPPLFAPQLSCATNTQANPPTPQVSKVDVQPPQFYVLNCPRCNDEITLDEDVLSFGHVDCPTCSERLEFDLDD